MSEKNLTCLRRYIEEDDNAKQKYFKLQDLTEDDELWLIKTPLHIDIESLHGKTVNLTADPHKVKKTDLETITHRCRYFTSVLLDGDRQELVPGPDIQGTVHVMGNRQGEVLISNELLDGNDFLPMPEQLKPDVVPPGSQSPERITRHKKMKKEKRKRKDREQAEEKEAVLFVIDKVPSRWKDSEKVKEQKKRKTIMDQNQSDEGLSIIIDKKPSISNGHKSHTQKKKHKKNISVE